MFVTTKAVVLVCIATLTCCAAGILQLDKNHIEIKPLRFTLNYKAPQKKIGHELLVNQGNYCYYGRANLGSPGQRMRVVFDMGTTLSWALSKKNPNQCMWMHQSFDDSRSKTVKMGDTFNGQLLYYNVTGHWVSDTMEFSQMTLKDQNFVQIEQWEGLGMCVLEYDAVIGLGIDAGGKSTHITVLDNMIKQKLLANPIFSLFLSNQLYREPGGELILGDIDKKYFTGNISYIQIDRTLNNWILPMTGLSVKDADADKNLVSFCDNEPCQVSIELGNAYNTGPADDIVKINEAIGATRFSVYSLFWDFDCSKIEGAPNVEIKLGSSGVFVLKPEYYIQDDGSGKCFSTFVGPQGQQTQWTLSVSFLQAYYSVFDYGNKRIGFAPARQGL